ncbi:hypothetical protein [Almyronema epifaneia]|uniref:Uncharacterized protein n=1 Tax=Almyronema epifaneia S1 TaxID=2991925 RepID=A0ABW6IC52_9CYAN
MQPNLSTLKISERELDTLTGLDVGEFTMGWAYRPSAFRQSRYLLMLLFNQLLTFGVVIIFCLPLGLIVARNQGLGEDLSSAAQFLPIALAVAIAIAVSWNVFRWWQGRHLITLARLLDEVDRYHETLTAVTILEELSHVNPSQLKVENQSAVLEALQLTRSSLVCALMTERILRKHQRFMARRQELFANIEHNLASLEALQVSQAANEYGDLLNDALQIGTIVHQEIQKLNSISS